MCAETPDYKATLNLPKTDFPMRAGLPKREPGWLERWEKIGVYDRLREKEGRQPFTLHDGPPYANGHLHIGHALNKTIKDMIVRSHQMMGYDARYIPGWDCHGLPIEWKIEEQYRKKGRDKDQVPINEFRAECREFARGWVDVQREEFKRLGITGNWENPYLTMDFHAERVIAEEFMKFLMNGTLYQGSKPVMWSPVEKTALAEAEVEYHDKESHTVWVKFKVVGTEGDLDGAQVVIWTTTPWTMPSNKAVVYGEGISYGLYEVTSTPDECWANVGERFLLADDLAADVFARARLEDGMWSRVRGVENDELAKISLLHPLAGAEGAEGEWDDLRDFRAADFVTSDEGTGFVHCAPSHGLEEYELYRDLGMLPQVITYNVMEDGRFRDDLPFFGGKAILKPNGKEGNANSAIIDKLVEVGGLLARGKIKHSYPHSWRSKAPVIYRNTPQWFAAIDKEVGDGLDQNGTTIRERALTCIDKVNWVPKSGRNRLYSMMEARPDWVDMELVEEGAAYERNATANLAPFLIRGAFIATFLNKYSALPMALTGTLGHATAARRVKETATFFATTALPGALDRFAQIVELNPAVMGARPHVEQLGAEFGMPDQRRQVVERNGHPHVVDRLSWIYRAILGRNPTPEELALGADFVKTGSWEQMAHILLMTNEMMFID